MVFAGAPDAKLNRIRQVGSLIIEDDVEIGASSCVDRGTLEDTRIGRGSKLDRQVYISHNVNLGSDCIVLGQSGVAGSTRIGDRSILCAQTGVREHLVLGEQTTVLARGFVVKSTTADSIVAGFPSLPAAQWRRLFGITKRLPELFSAYRKQLKTSESAMDDRENTNG